MFAGVDYWFVRLANLVVCHVRGGGALVLGDGVVDVGGEQLRLDDDLGTSGDLGGDDLAAKTLMFLTFRRDTIRFL